MGAITPRRAGKPPSAPNSKSLQMVGVIAAELPPTLPAGKDIRTWLAETSEFIGQHPDPVLADACAQIRSTKTFAPSKAELVQAVLDAYMRLGMALSPDAKRHLAYRKKLPARYSLDADGRKRFADDAHVLTVAFTKVYGPQANLMLDEVEGTVDDAEKAVLDVQKMFGGNERPAGEEVLRAFRSLIGMQAAYRTHGDPGALCGGLVGSIVVRSGAIQMHSPWLALSETFVARMHDRYPYARTRDDVHLWAEAMREAFVDVARRVDTARYGTAQLQADAEAEIDRLMAEKHRFGRGELLTRRRYEARQIETAIQAISVTEIKLRGGAHSFGDVELAGERFPIDTLEKCANARRRAQSLSERIGSEIAALSAAK